MAPQMENTKYILGGEFRVVVYYEDTDFSGYVYHANYLKFFERAREEILGVPRLKELYLQGKHFVVRQCQLFFHKPASHGDELLIKSRGLEPRGASMLFEQEAYRCDAGQWTKIVTGSIELVSIGPQGQPIRIPLS